MVASCGTAAPLLVAVCAGTAAGFAGGVTSGILSGQDLGGVMKSGLIGAGTGLVCGALGGVASTFAPAGALWGSLYGAGTGSVIGGVGSVMTGGDIKEGIIFGAATGLVGGGFQGYCSAKSQGLNPWTGKGKMPKIPNYDLTLETGDFAENVTLYRKTSGSEEKPGYLFMTDNYEYAQSYVQNGGSVECVVLPRSAIYAMSNNGSGDLIITSNPQIHKINGVEYRGCEYTFSPRVKGLIVPLMK